jgi:hypothetical protein
MNFIEDNLIRQIDLDRSGIDQETLEDEAILYEHRLSFFLWAAEESYLVACKHPDKSDLTLSRLAGAFAIREALEREAIHTLCRRTQLSQRRIKLLAVDNPSRVEYEYHESQIRKFKHEREELDACVGSRKFLKSQRGLIRIYLSAKGRGQEAKIDFSMKWLEAAYPAL